GSSAGAWHQSQGLVADRRLNISAVVFLGRSYAAVAQPLTRVIHPIDLDHLRSRVGAQFVDSFLCLPSELPKPFVHVAKCLIDPPGSRASDQVLAQGHGLNEWSDSFPSAVGRPHSRADLPVLGH